MATDLATLLLAKAEKLPQMPDRVVMGRKSSFKPVYDAARPAIRAALCTGMTATEVTNWILSQLPAPQRPADITQGSKAWNRWYAIVRRERTRAT